LVITAGSTWAISLNKGVRRGPHGLRHRNGTSSPRLSLAKVVDHRRTAAEPLVAPR
jgi:hypothetical protein